MTHPNTKHIGLKAKRQEIEEDGTATETFQNKQKQQLSVHE